MEQKYIDEELDFAHGDKLRHDWRPKEIYLFRASPVPLTGRSRRYWNSGTYRHNRFIRTRRWNEAHKEWFNLRKKGKEYIPDPWDDYPRERSKNWKSYRKTQYK